MQHANDFAAYYERTTGQAISSTDAQNMLLANGYIRVDSLAASGPGYNEVAAQYLTANAGGLFSATPAEMANPQLGRNPDGTPTPEVYALPGGAAVPGADKAAGAGLGLATLGVAAPGAATAWALGTTYDCVGDAIGHMANPQANDSPDFSKSFTVGGVAGLMSPLVVPIEALGSSALAKIIVTGYNSVVTGTAAFGGTAITTSENSPSLSAGLGGTANALGVAAQTWLPKHLGDIVNQVIQVLPGPIQSGIENNGKQQK